MPYALLQKDLSPVPSEKLKNAFRLLPQLVDADATSMAADAYGILVDNLSAQDARTLQRSLAQQGLETEVVDRSKLVTLPRAERVMKAECTASAFNVSDVAGRPHNINWENVILIAAGNVRRFQWERKESTRWTYHAGAGGRGGIPIPHLKVSTKEVRNYTLLLEVFSKVRPPRIRITAEEFHYEYLGSRLRPSALENFKLLVQDLLSHARRARPNRGAQAIDQDPAAAFMRYPSIHAFDEETIWLFHGMTRRSRE